MRYDVEAFYKRLTTAYQMHRGDALKAFLQRELEAARASSDDDGIVIVSNELGSVLRVRGEAEASLALYADVLERLRRRGMQRTASFASARINQGGAWMVAGNPREALQSYDEAIDILNQLPETTHYQRAAALNNRSQAYRACNQLEAAIRDIRQALQLLPKTPDARGERATSLTNYANIELLRGEFAHARTLLQEALDIFDTESGGRDIHYPNALATYGELEYYCGNYESSAAYYQLAIDKLRDKVGDAASTALLERNRARSLRLSREQNG